MSRSSIFLLCLLSFGASLCAEITISFPKSGYTLREVIDRIQHETPFDIDLPFIDTALVKTQLPKKLEFKESLFWISRYHEKYNQLLIHFKIDGRKVRFIESFPSTSHHSKVLDQNVHLKGKKWTVHDALRSAGSQLKISIRLPMSDQAKLSSDYNYECSLRELLDEVRMYWLEYNSQRLIYRHDKSGILFTDGGNTPKPTASLDVELMGDLKQVKSKNTQKEASGLPSAMPWDKILEPKKANQQIETSRRPLPPQVMVTHSKPKAFTQPKKNKSRPNPLSEVQPIDLQPPSPTPPSPSPSPKNLSLQLAELKNFEPLNGLTQDQRMVLVNDLIRPHLRQITSDGLADWISSRLPNRRGINEWVQKVRDLEISNLNAFEKKATLRNLQEAWLKKILAQTRFRQGPKAPDQGWHRLYRLGFGAGRYPLLTTSHPARQVESDGVWHSQDLLLDYRFNPPGPWNYGFGVGIGAVLATKPKALSESYFSFHYLGERHVSQGSLETVSPFLDMEVVTDALSDGGLLEHQLWTTGLTLHWRETPLRSGDLVSSSTFHISKFLPKGDSRFHFFYPNADLRQDGFGYRHQWSWSEATPDTAQGPHGDIFLVHNKGQHASNDGVEYGFGFGYHYNREVWKNSLDFGYSQWDRQPKSDSLRFEWTSRKALGRGDGILHLLHEIRESNQTWFDGSSTLAELSWEVTW